MKRFVWLSPSEREACSGLETPAAFVSMWALALQFLPPESLFTINVGRSRSVARFCVDVRVSLWLSLCLLP